MGRKSVFLFHKLKSSLLVICVMLMTSDSSISSKLAALQDYPNEGYFFKETNAKYFVPSKVKHKSYDKFYNCRGLQTETFGDRDEHYIPAVKNHQYKLLNHNEHERQTDSVRSYNLEVRLNELDDNNSECSGNMDGGGLFKIMGNTKKKTRGNVFFENNDVISNSSSSLREDQNKNIYFENNKFLNNIFNGPKLFHDGVLNHHKSLAGESGQHEHSGSDVIEDANTYLRKDNRRNNTHDIPCSNITSEKSVRASFQKYNGKIIKPKIPYEYDDTEETFESKNGSDHYKKKSGHDRCGKKELIIIQPIQSNEMQNSGNYISINKDYGHLNTDKFNKEFMLTKSGNGYSCNKKVFLLSANAHIRHDQQELSDNSMSQINQNFKNWDDHILHSRAYMLKNDNVQMENDLGRQLRRSPFRQKNHMNLDNYHTKMGSNVVHELSYEDQCLDKLNHDNSFKNFENSDKKISQNQVIFASFKHKNQPTMCLKALSDFESNDEKEVSHGHKISLGNIFPCISMKVHPENLNSFKTKEEVSEHDDGSVHDPQQHSFRIVKENYFKNGERNSVYDDIDPLEMLVNSKLVNDSGNVTESNFNGSYIGSTALRRKQSRNHRSLFCDYGSDNKPEFEIKSLKNISENEVSKLTKSVSHSTKLNNFLVLEDEKISDSKKRSVLNKPDASLRPFHHNHKEFTDKPLDYREDIANFSDGNSKSSYIIYDYDFNDEKNGKSNFDGVRGKDIIKQGSVIGDLEKSNESDKLLKHKYTKKKPNILFESNACFSNTGNRFVVSGIKKYKGKPKKNEQMTDDSSQTVQVSTGKSVTHSKKYTESMLSNFGYLAAKSVGRQCHPPAAPPKFRWCSEDSDPVKDQEYEDALKGKVALRIVEVILAKVQKSAKMTSDFGFCSNQNRPVAADEDTECIAQNSILKSEDMKDILSSLDKMSYKSCNQLPPKLKSFLEWLVKVKHVRTVHSKGMSSRKHSQSDCSFGNSAFLFHKYGKQLSDDYPDVVVNQDNYYGSSPFKSVVDYDFDSLGNVKKFVDTNKFYSNSIGSDENLAKEDSNLISEQLKHVFMEKNKRQASKYEKYLPRKVSSINGSKFKDNSGYSYNNGILPANIKDIEIKNITDNSMSNIINYLRDHFMYDADNSKFTNQDVNHKISFDSYNYGDKDYVQEPLDKFQFYSSNHDKLDQLRMNTDAHPKINDRKLIFQDLHVEKYPDLHFDSEKNNYNEFNSFGAYYTK